MAVCCSIFVMFALGLFFSQLYKHGHLAQNDGPAMLYIYYYTYCMLCFFDV